MTLAAEPDGGGGYRLSGEKLWISNAPEADIYTVFARAPEGITAFAVPGGSDGLSGEPRQMLAEHAIGSLSFDSVPVPAGNVLGEPGAGFKVAMRTLDLFRPSVGAFAIGMAGAALSIAVDYTRTRETFGKPLSRHQAVAHRLADISARVAAARLLVHQAAAAHDAGMSDPALAAIREAGRDRGRAGGGRRGGPVPRRQRPRGGSPARAPVPARPRPPDLRGRIGDPARDHRPPHVRLATRGFLMDYGVFLPVSGAAATGDGLKHAAATAERLGFTTVWAADRIIIPWEIETSYAYSWSDSFIVPPEKPFLDAMTALAFLAGATDRIRLGISVLVGPYRDPIHFSKIAATISRLSEERFILGYGIGWMEEEFEALGRGELFHQRGRVGDEQLAVARNLFEEDHCSFAGDFYSYEDIAFYPKGSVPIWCGGESAAAQRRAGRFGDAWFPYFARITPEELRSRYETVLRAAGEAGRDRTKLSLNCCLSVEVTEDAVEQQPDMLRGDVDQVIEAIGRFEDAGVEHLALQFIVGRYPERLRQMEALMPELTR